MLLNLSWHPLPCSLCVLMDRRKLPCWLDIFSTVGCCACRDTLPACALPLQTEAGPSASKPAAKRQKKAEDEDEPEILANLSGWQGPVGLGAASAGSA